MSRDLLGYGQHYPRGRWPNEARLAISLVLNYEEGAEQCIGDGDPEGERVGEFVYPSMDAHTRDRGTESTVEYGARVGVWRVLDLLGAYNIKATIYACGRAVERNPARPRMLSIGLHARLSGRPGRATALERFLDFCAHQSAIIFLRRVDIARWWHQNYPPSEASQA